MSCHGNNATPPSPAIAPGADGIDTAAVARELGRRGVDPRLPATVPGFDAPFFQAGLAGYSDAPMRIVARRHGCPMCITEALLDRSLLAGGHGFDKADLDLIRDNIPGGDEDRPTSGQIIGSDSDEMAAAAVKMIEGARRADREYRRMAYGDGGFPKSTHVADVVALPDRTATVRERDSVAADCRTFATIDVNLACPVKKIAKKARGGHWLAEPDGAVAILRAVREAVPREIPCTLKLRRSYDDTPENARNFERIFNTAYELGYAWATVHARTVEQKYIGPSRWPFLKDLVARHPDKVIFGSGDVWSVHDIFRMIAYTGVHAVSVARGCIGNPWIFRQARQMMAGEPPAPPTVAEQRSVLEEHFRLAVAWSGEDVAGKQMRKFGIKFSAHHPRAEEVRLRMIAVHSLADWERVLEDLYAGTEADRPAAHGAGALVS